ncbi:pyridoxamine 5'-phosphate oxidase family protein [Spirosoma montaniterrae]|uniref:pyridoxamine 5'-phosphate oxidase family protein n=1 Tax=Spirosoma montaniterrae TaxID=1178516 RepID=UPI001E36FA60|nr:pyridoxamine 5'-phosphate oxidase family protein [Spirosoma montaniterrae]
MNSLNDLERDAWLWLTSAPKRKRDGFKTMTLATRTLDGVNARTVVLRKADADAKTLWFHTDVRSDKVGELSRHPKATLLFWDNRRQIQLRLSVTTAPHTDDAIASEHWAGLWVGGRKMYLSEHMPGLPYPEPYPGFPAQFGENLPTEAESEAGRNNFLVVECRVLTMDYLHLSRAGQTRARFRYEPFPGMEWLVP